MKDLRDALFYLAGIVLACSIAIAVLYAIYCTVTWTWMPEHFMAILVTILIVSVPLYLLGGIIHLLSYIPTIIEKCQDYPSRKMKPLGKEEKEKPGEMGVYETVETRTIANARVEPNLAYIGILPWMGSFLGNEVITVVFSDGTTCRGVLPNGWEKGSNILAICNAGDIVCQLQTAGEVDKMLETIRGKSRQARARKLVRMIDDLPRFQISVLARRYLDKLAASKGRTRRKEQRTEIFIEQKEEGGKENETQHFFAK